MARFFASCPCRTRSPAAWQACPLHSVYTRHDLPLVSLREFHKYARLRYHLLHSPACEHFFALHRRPCLRIWNRDQTHGIAHGHARMPVFRVAGSCNATPCAATCLSSGSCMFPGGPGVAGTGPGTSFCFRQNWWSYDPSKLHHQKLLRRRITSARFPGLCFFHKGHV